MTYQNHSDDKAAADEASSLFLSSGDAKPKQKTNGVPTVPTMQARIATCLFLLGTLAVLFWGGSSNTFCISIVLYCIILDENARKEHSIINKTDYDNNKQ